MAQLKKDFSAQPAPFADFDVKLCEVIREPADLDQRIEVRVAAMMSEGLVEEVRALLARGLKQNRSAAGAIGYRETIDFLEGRLREADLAPAIISNTRALVKKQRTWFRTQLPAHPLVAAATAAPDSLFPSAS